MINEEDIITFDRWEDMSLSKLRYVIKISYIDNKKNFCHAFNAKALYKLWKVNHYNDEIFKNPFSQKPFTEEDKNTILITLGKRDFRYDSDDNYTSAINARYDVVFNKSIIKIKRHGGPKKFRLALAVSHHLPRPRHWLSDAAGVLLAPTTATVETDPPSWPQMQPLKLLER